ncbi:MAG: cbb3-type cytochrome oxidase assembly protein CcoS [Planctomycetota bacterium]
MMVLFIMLPIALLLAACAIGTFVWAARAGQFDDLDTPPMRAMLDDELND